jgi:hypothetical protein
MTYTDPAAYSLVLKHAGSFAGTSPQLRLRASVDKMATRLKQCLSEELATGVTCYVMREHLGADHIADVGPLIGHDVDYVAGATHEYEPDYYAIDSMNDAFFVESKGAVGTRSILSAALDHGKLQVENVTATSRMVRRDCGRLVIATHFCVEGKHTRSATGTVIRDPAGDRGQETHAESDLPVRVAYAKVLRYCRQHELADRLLLQELWPELRWPLLSVGNWAFVPIGYGRFGGLVCVEKRIFKLLGSETGTHLTRAIHGAVAEFRRGRQDLGLAVALPNGIALVRPDEKKKSPDGESWPDANDRGAIGWLEL